MRIGRFQSTLPYGSDFHCPLIAMLVIIFQSTLPYGSDSRVRKSATNDRHFNPRSLTGATIHFKLNLTSNKISIHAPLRERPFGIVYTSSKRPFQSTLPYGSDAYLTFYIIYHEIFQSTLPYGSDITTCLDCSIPHNEFQSTLPYGSDSIKTKYFSINLNQAFIANKLNSNPQRFYFDVRKLLVSHSSSSCEPKLKFMFHITSHRINLDYFSSCQSICK